MTIAEKVNIINNLRNYVFELKASSKPINSEFENILKGLQEIRKHESTPIIADIIFEYEKFIRLPLAEKHDKISIMLESIKGVIGHYKHKQT